MWNRKISRRSLLATAAAAPIVGTVAGPQSAATAATTLFEDSAHSIHNAGWTMTASPTAGSYITDATQSQGNPFGIDMKPVPNGNYLLYADRISSANQTYSEMVKFLPAKLTGQWEVTIRIRINRLPVAHDRAPLRGLSVVINTGAHRFQFGLVDTRILALSDSGGSNYIERFLDVPANGFHDWTFRYEGSSRFSVLLDGHKIAHFVSIAIDSESDVGRLTLRVSAGDWAADWAEIYVDRVSVTQLDSTPTQLWKDTDIAGITVLPTSTASKLNLVTNLINIDPAQVSAGKVSVTATVRNGKSSTSSTAIATGAAVPLTLTPPNRPGEVELEIRAHAATGAPRRGQILGVLKQKWTLPSAVHELRPGSSVTSTPSVAHLFTAMDGIGMSGWELGTYTYEGTSVAQAFVESTPEARSFTFPADLRGWYAAYVGYLTGTQEFDVAVGSDTATIAIPDAPASPGEPTGPLQIREVCVLVRRFDGQRITIKPIEEKHARIAYLRLLSLTSDQIRLASKPNESTTGAHKRVYYDNDGMSQWAHPTKDVFSGTENFLPIAIDHYIGQDVGALMYCTGTSLFVAYDSSAAGRPYDAVPADQVAKLPAYHQRARTNLLSMIDAGTSPVELLTERGKEVGIEVWSNHRMNQFEVPKTDYLNGKLWPQHQQYVQKAYRGETIAGRPRLSFAHPEYRDILKTLLIEQAALPHIDGLHLDYCRWPWHVEWPADLVQAYQTTYGIDPHHETSVAGSERWMRFRATVVTEFMRDLRKSVPGTKISVRVPYFGWLEGGMDIQAWIDEGLIDILIPSVAQNHEPFWRHADVFPEMTAGTSVKLLGGIQDIRIKTGRLPRQTKTKVTSDQYQERAHEFYEAGYDGIFIFNNWLAERSLGLLGDRVRNKKWRIFEYPGQWVDSRVGARIQQSITVSEFSAEVEELIASGSIRRDLAGCLRRDIRLLQTAADHNNDHGVTSAVTLIVSDLKHGVASGHTDQITATRLRVAARVVERALI